MVYKKPCKDCGEMFLPVGRYYRFCDDCVKKRLEKRTEKLRMMRKNGKEKTN